MAAKDWNKTIRQRLEEGGRKGLTKSKVAGSGKAANRALLEMLNTGEVVRLGPERGGLLFLKHLTPDLESVAEELDQMLQTAPPSLLTRAELTKKLGAAKKELAEEAFPLMIADGVFFEFRRAKSSYYLHLGSFDKERGLSAEPGVPPEPAVSSSLDKVRLLRAYESLRNETGFAAVYISTLAEKSRIALAELKPFLLDEALAHRAVLSEGDWSIASPAIREGVIEFRGKKYLQIEFRS